MSPTLIVLLVIVVLFVIIALWYISALNSLNRQKVKINESLSGIDVALEKRYDVLTKMLDTVKAYAKHENEVFFKTIELRSGMSMAERNQAMTDMDAQQKSFFALAENYPDMKSSDNFKTLQLAIANVEETLQAVRRSYNANVSYFNQMIVTFPTSIVANQKHFTKQDFFEAEEGKKEDVKMDFEV